MAERALMQPWIHDEFLTLNLSPHMNSDRRGVEWEPWSDRQYLWVSWCWAGNPNPVILADRWKCAPFGNAEPPVSDLIYICSHCSLQATAIQCQSCFWESWEHEVAPILHMNVLVQRMCVRLCCQIPRLLEHRFPLLCGISSLACFSWNVCLCCSQWYPLPQLIQQKQDRHGETNQIMEWFYRRPLEPIGQDRLPSLLERFDVAAPKKSTALCLTPVELPLAWNMDTNICQHVPSHFPTRFTTPNVSRDDVDVTCAAPDGLPRADVFRARSPHGHRTTFVIFLILKQAK